MSSGPPLQPITSSLSLGSRNGKPQIRNPRKMVLGRLAHYAFDVVLLSTVAAGVKRSTGFQVSTQGLPDGPVQQTAETILGVGERVFDYTAALSYSSAWFEREVPTTSTAPRK
ncbi:BQ2448_6176 [Microbotryum intermedium]|uniref:BQ2448_6176 protein n=1 Tax=Microbotryum intermedium TaxID=269621 RepID=A0A238FRL6_9BASI|nr:BQ2448_6176 [Microbotryum intermedium]